MRFDEKVQGAAVCFTGEGRMDSQSIRYGKAPAAVAERCRRQNVPCIAIVDGLGAGGMEFCRENQSVLPIAPGPISLNECIVDAGDLVADAVERALRIYAMR